MHGPRRRPHRPRPRRIFAAGRRRCRRRPCRPCLAAPTLAACTSPNCATAISHGMPSDARWTPRFPHSSVQPSPSAAASQPQLRRRPRAAGRMRTRYSVVSHEALAVSHGSPAPLAPPIFGPAAVHDVSSPILLPLSQPYHPRASTRRAVAGARPGLICEAVLWAKLEP